MESCVIIIHLIHFVKMCHFKLELSDSCVVIIIYIICISCIVKREINEVGVLYIL